MKFLLRSLHFLRENVLKRHYINYHFIREDVVHFQNLFESDTLDKTCTMCRKTFDSAGNKKKRMLLFHYLQTGGRGNNPRMSDLPLNILRRLPLTYYSINFVQHKIFYDFFSTGMVDVFLQNVYQVFQHKKENKIQTYIEIINQTRGEIVLENKRVWLTDVYHARYFNDFMRGELCDQIIKRVIVNDESGSSWYFKRFERLSVNVVSLSEARNLMSS